MPFRVVMPDGTVVDNVPDGTTREEFDSRAARNGYGRATTSFSAQTITPVDDPSPFQSPAPIVPRGTSQSPPRPAAMLEQRVVDDLAELRQPGINRSPISHRVQTLSKFYGERAPAYEGLIDLLYDDYPKHHALIDKHIKAGLDPVRIRAIVRAQDEEDRKAEAARQKHEFERNLAGITDPVQQKAVADMTGSIEQLRSEIGRTDTPEAVGLMDLGLGGAARQAAAEGQMRNIMRKRTDASMLPDNTTTATGAFTAEMLSKAAPMASGFAAAPAGAEAGLVGGPILSLVGGLGAFYVAYATADYAQRKAFELAAGPELTAQVKQYADTYRQEHPAATALGSEAPYLAMMKPNPTHFREVLGAAKAVRTGTAFTPAQKTAMLTVGSGIGIMGGMEGISQIREGDLNVPRLATSIGLGAVLHEPRLGGPVTGQRPRPDLPTELNPQSPAYVAAQKALERETAMAAGAPYRRAGMTLPDLATPLADRPGPTRADIPAAIEPARQGLSPADYLANITAERTRVSDQATAEIANALESRKSYKSRREYLTGRAKAAGVNIDGYNNAEAIPKIVEGEARNAALRPVRMPAERQTIPLDKVLASRAERERIARVLKIRNPHNLPDADLESALVEALTNPKTLKSLSELDRASVFGSEEIAPVANQHAERVQMLDPNAALEPAVGAEPLPVRQKAYIEPDASAGRALTYRPTLKQSLEDTRGLPRLPDEPSPLSPAPAHPPDAASGTTAGEPLPPPKPPEPTSPPPAKAAPAKPTVAESPAARPPPQPGEAKLPFRDGQSVIIRTTANGKAYAKPKRAQIIQVVDDKTATIRVQNEHGYRQISLARLEELPNIAAARKRMQSIMALPSAERSKIIEADRAIKEAADNATYIPNSGGPSQRISALKQAHARKALYERYALESGRDVDMSDVVARAGEKDAFIAWAKRQTDEMHDAMYSQEAQRSVRQVKESVPKTIDEPTLNEGDLVYRDGEWYMVKRDADGLNTKLVDGETIAVEDFGQTTAQGVISKQQTGYDEALLEYRAQEQQAAKPLQLERPTAEQLTEERSTLEQRAKIRDEQNRRLTAKPIDTTGDMFDPLAAENPLFSARPQNLAAETAARGQRGAVRVGGLAEVAQRVQNKFRGLFQREKLKDAMTEFDYHRAAGEQMVKRHGATLQALRAELTKAGYPDKQVFDDLVATFTTEPSGSMTADQFIAKYNLDPAMQASVREMIQTAKNMANALGPRLKQAGMEGRGGLVAANELYSTVAYMKHQTRGAYEPTPSAVAAAESHIESVFSKAIDGIAKRATSFKRRGANNIIAFLNEPNRALARAHLSGLTPAQMDAAHALKSRYENSKSMIGMLVDNGQSIVAMKNQQAMSDAAKQFVHEIQQPRKAPMEMTSGMGSAIDNLTRRELEPVFRELFGEIKDPAFVYPASREIQGELIDRLALMHRASEVAGIHSEQRNSEMGHTVRLTSSQDLYGPVTAADRSKYGVLAGKWVAPQVKEFLGGRERGSRLRQAEDVLNKIAGIQRGGALLRIARPIRDKVSNLFSFASGARDTAFPVIFTKYYAKAESMLWKYVKARAANDQRGIAEARAFFEDLSKKGIFRATSSSVFEDLERAMTGIPGGKTLQNLQKLSAYWADLPTKYAGYMTRMEKAAAWGIANPEIEALRHLQRGYDNRDAIPIVVRGFAKKWYAPDFLTFKASSLRSMALNAVDMVADMANPKIPALDKLRMLAAWSQSMTTQALLTTTKAGIWATKRAAQATLLYKASGLLSKDGKVVEPEVSDALRYMAPTFAQQDAVDVFSDTDNKGNPVLIKATVGSGSWSAYPLLDVLYGAMQSADVEGLQNTPGQSLLRQFVGTGGNIPINNLVQLFSGENLGDPDYRVGLTKGVAEAIKALFNNDLDHDEKMKRAKFYGWEATKRIMEYGGKALGSAVDVPARASRQEAIKESASTRWSRKVEGGDRLPIGIYPVTDYIPTRDAKDVLAQSVSPMNVQVFSHEDLRYNMLLKAEYMKRTLFPADEPSQREENRTMSEPERMSREDAQLERMRPWVQYSTTLLKSIGDDPQPRLIDMLKKAGFAERQITNLLELPEGSLQDRGARLPKLFKPATLQRLRSSL